MRGCGAGAGAGPAQGLVFGPTVLIWGLLWAPLCSGVLQGIPLLSEARKAHVCPGSHSRVACPFPRNLLKLLDGGRLSHSPQWC